MRYSGIGGQAVMEGVMMKNQDKYAVAVRKPDGDIAIEIDKYESFVKNEKITKIPFVRGTFNFIDSLILGMKTLMFSASFYEEKDEVVLTADEAAKKKKKEDLIMTITMIASVVLAMALFMVLPYFVSRLFKNFITSRFLLTVVEAIVRIGLFVAYILAVSKMEDIQRTFMYHGAEHKTIACYEAGHPVPDENTFQATEKALEITKGLESTDTVLFLLSGGGM